MGDFRMPKLPKLDALKGYKIPSVFSFMRGAQGYQGTLQGQKGAQTYQDRRFQ